MPDDKNFRITIRRIKIYVDLIRVCKIKGRTNDMENSVYF